MKNPDWVYDDSEDQLEEARWDEYQERLKDEPLVYISEAITESNSELVDELIRNLRKEHRLPETNARLGEVLLKLVHKYTLPDDDWCREKVAEIAADQQDRADYEYDQWKDRQADEKWDRENLK